MVRKIKNLQIQFVYDRLDEQVFKSYALNRDSSSMGLDYRTLCYYRDDFVEEQHIRTQVRMSYMTEDGGEAIVIGPEFFMRYSDIEKEYEGTLVVMLNPVIMYINSRIDEIERKINDIFVKLSDLKQQKITIPIPPDEIMMNKHVSAPERLAKIQSTMPAERALDIGVLFSEPLVQQTNAAEEVRLSAEPVKFREEIERLKQALQKTTRGEIFIKCLIASTEKLRFLLNMKVKILHIICHGVAEKDKNTGQIEGALCFEQLNKIGCMDKIYGRQITDMLRSIPQEHRPQLVFINACHSQLIGQAFLHPAVTIPFVVAIQATQKIEDTAAQIFAQKFYNNLFNGLSVRKSFTDAKDSLDRLNRPVNTNICCCFHPAKHEKECLWIRKIEEMKQSVSDPVAQLHDLYHVALCKCSKRHLNIHELTCKWALDTLFEINKDFRIKTEDGYRQPNSQQLSPYQQLLLCCCSNTKNSIPHDESQKFKFNYSPNADPERILFEPNIADMDSQVYDLTPIELQKDFKNQERLFGRGMDTYKLIEQLMDKQRLLIVFGNSGSGRSVVVRKAITYLIQRGFFKDQYIHVNLSNCSKNIDFQFAFLNKVHHLKCSSMYEVLRKLEMKEVVLVLDNCDLFIQISHEDFSQEVNNLLDALKQAKIIIIVNDKTEKMYGMTIPKNENKYKLQSLSKMTAAEMLLYHAKQYIENVTVNEAFTKNLWALFDDQKMRTPKTVLDLVQWIKSHYSPTNRISLQALSDKVKNNMVDSDKFLEQNLNNLKKNPAVYRLFLFIAQFQGGLTQLDFSIMSKQQDINNYEPQLTKVYSAPPQSKPENEQFIDPNWKILLEQLLAEKNPEGSDFMKEGESYYCIVQQKAQGFKNIKIKKYILDYLKRFDENFEVDLRFKALAYLSNFSSLLIRLFKQKYYYHQQLAEYSNVSRSGFFQYEHSIMYATYYDEGEYFPDQRTEHLSKSISRGRQLDDQINDIFEGSKLLQERHPAESIIQHQDNFLQMYNNDYSEYYQRLSPDRKKIFRYYYFNILLNIPTLVKLVSDKFYPNFLKFCIEESRRKVSLLEPKASSVLSPTKAPVVSKTENMYILKLKFMSIANQILTSKIPQEAKFYNTFFQTMKSELCWDKNPEIEQTETLDYFYLKICASMECFKLNMKQETYNNIKTYSTSFRRTLTQDKMNEGNQLLFAKYSLVMVQFYILIAESESQHFIEARSTVDHGLKLLNIQQARQLFHARGLIQLQAEAYLCLAKISVVYIKRVKTIEDVNYYFNIRSNSINPCRRLIRNPQYKLNAKEYERQLTDIEDKLNSKILKITKNYLVFMRANPTIYENSENVILFNCVKRSTLFQKTIQELLNPNEHQSDKQSGKNSDLEQKELSVRFQILTVSNLMTILNHGCSILVLKLNTIVNKQGMWMQMQSENTPVEQKIDVQKFITDVHFSTINILVLSGQNSKLLATKITNTFEQAPIIIALDHSRDNPDEIPADFFDYGYNEFSKRMIQRLASNHFICELFWELMYGFVGKITVEEITQAVRRAKQQTIVYLLAFSKSTNSQENRNRLITFEMFQPRGRIIELQFQKGIFHDVSIQKSNLHNLKQIGNDNYVGREKCILTVLKTLLQNLSQSKPSYINIYGNKGCGKTAFITELASLLLERGHFKSGIYILKSWEIVSTFKSNINDYLEKHKKDIFTITYLNERKVDTKKMLIIMDDFHALKDRSNYFDYFFNSMYNNGVSFILTSHDPLSANNIPDFKDRVLWPFGLKILAQMELALLSFMFIPLYDPSEFRDQFRNMFNTLKRKQRENGVLPKALIDNFQKMLQSANKKNSVQNYKHYQNYIRDVQVSTTESIIHEKPRQVTHHLSIQHGDTTIRKSGRRDAEELSARQRVPKMNNFLK